MKVTLIAHTPDAVFLVAEAAKLCYSPSSIKEIKEGLSYEDAADFVNMLAEIGHESPAEHASFTFGIEGVSRSLLAQITRHRIASYSVQSQRYVRENAFEYVVPPEIENIPLAKKEFISAMEEDQRHYDNLTKILAKHHKIRLLSEGTPKSKAESAAQKLAIEDARYVLPNACSTKIMLTMNTRSLLNFFRQRCCNRAQWEIHQLADEMLKLVYDTAPALFKNAGPGCLKGPCPEGKMTCKRISDVREKYNSLYKE